MQPSVQLVFGGGGCSPRFSWCLVAVGAALGSAGVWWRWGAALGSAGVWWRWVQPSVQLVFGGGGCSPRFSWCLVAVGAALGSAGCLVAVGAALGSAGVW